MLDLSFTPFPQLSTQRLALRRVNRDDANALFGLRSDAGVMKFIDRPLAKSIDDAYELIQKIDDGIVKNEGIAWAVTLNSDLKLIGHIGFHRIMKEHYRAEIGYLLHPDFQGKGIMQESITAVIDYGFRIMNLHSIEANVNPGNSASIKLLERNHFVNEAYFKENYFSNGKFLDTAIYSLLSPIKLNLKVSQ